MIALLAGVLYYIREVTVALSSVRQEAGDERFEFPEPQPVPHDPSIF
jgi:hypothetical protein